MMVSVVVPTFHRRELLQKCLAALDAQTLDVAKYEIIIADDAAAEETRQQVEAFAAGARAAVRYLPVRPAHGPAAARNVGWRAARGELIAFTDDDCEPQPRWLTEACAAFERDPQLVAVSGRIIVPLSSRPTDFELDTAGLEQSEFVTANCICRRAVLTELGGFDERFTTAWREDSDLQFAILTRGGRLAFVPDAVVVHPVRPAPWGVSLRMQRKALFEALLFKKYPALYRQRIQPGTPWDYYGMTASLAAAAVAALCGSPWFFLIAMGVWLLLMARFLARRLRRSSWAPGHVLEMIATSLAIPMLSVCWRLYGAWRFRVFFL